MGGTTGSALVVLWMTWIVKVDEGQWKGRPPGDLLVYNLGETTNFRIVLLGCR